VPLVFGEFTLDEDRRQLLRAGVPIPLEPKAYELLTLLLARRPRALSKDQIHQVLWAGTFVSESALAGLIADLRSLLGDDARRPRYIRTVHGFGYAFSGDARTVDELASDSSGPVVRTLELSRAGTQPSVDRERAPAGRSIPLRGWIGKGTAIGIGTLILVIAAIALLRRTPPGDSAPARVGPLTRLAGKEAWPAFAPDGEQVAFAWSGEKFDNTDIHVTLVGSTAVRRLTTDPAEDYAPSWSPDGRRIAFLRRVGHGARIHVISALGGPDQRVSDFPVSATPPNSLMTMHITWSPDGRYVVAGRDPRDVSGDSAGLYLIPIEGGPARAITRPKPPAFHFSPVFSPDGRRVAYASCLYPNCAVAMVDVEPSFTPASAERTLTSQPVDPAGMAWSRDGKSILFIGEGSSSWNLWRLWIDGTREPETIELAGANAEHPATATSRDRLVFSRYDWDMHLYRFAPGKPLERFAASSSFEGDPHFSPDGRHIAFFSARSGKVAIWVAAADGSEPRQLTSDRSGWQGSPNWSPDGRTIAFDAHDPDGAHVWTIPAEGGTPRRITKPTGHQTVPTWSRDGRWVYFSETREGGGRDIWRVPAAGGRAEQLTRTGTGYLAIETADGAGLLYQPKYGDSPLLVMPLKGAGPPRRLIECVRHASFIPVGTTIVYAGCEPGTSPSLHSIDLLSGRDRLLGTLEHSPPNQLGTHLAVSPDGKTILFSGLMRHGADLMLIENFR
jgi:eukaryotic-like serine/threonine-protein kinase